MSEEDGAFGYHLRSAFGMKDKRIADLQARLDEHGDCAAELAVLRAELIGVKRDRDEWKRLAFALTDRNAEYRDEIARNAGPFGYLEGRPDGDPDARRR